MILEYDLVKELKNLSEKDIRSNFFYDPIEYKVGEVTDIDNESILLLIAKLAIDEITVEDSYGGEDMGVEFYTVISFKKRDEIVYIKFNGYYYSYDGATYEEFKVVTPQQVVVIEYNDKYKY